MERYALSVSLRIWSELLADGVVFGVLCLVGVGDL